MFKKVIQYSIVFALSTGVLKLLSFLITLWMARSLEVYQYSQWGMFLAIQSGIVILVLSGIYEAIIGLLGRVSSSEEREHILSVGQTYFFYSVSTILTVALFIIFYIYNINNVMPFIFVLFSGGALAYVTLKAQISRLQGQNLFSIVFSFFIPLASTLFGMLFFSFKNTILAFYMGACLGYVVMLFFLYVMSPSRQPFFPRMSAEKKIIFFRTLPYFAINIFGWINGYGNNILIHCVFSPEEVARFTFIFSIASFIQFCATAFNQSWGATFFRFYHSGNVTDLEKQGRFIFWAQAIVLGITGMLMIIVLSPLLIGLGGNLQYYSNMKTELFIMVASFIILIPYWNSNNYILANDAGRIMLIIVSVTGILGILLWFFLMRMLGPIGIYIGFFIQMLLRSSATAFFAYRLWQVRSIWGRTFFALCLSGVGWLVAK